MKKIINKAEDIVIEMCNGMVMAHPELEFVKKYKIIMKKEINPNKVSLISGGGSGHEPAHAGFVGKGMLDAAVCGDIFASPSQIQVYQALKATAGNKGALMIIKNYTGDMMNFRNAAFMAEEDGLQVDYVVVNDDISVQDSLYTVGRRGVAGTVLVHKIAGAAAEEGRSLEQVKAAAEKAAANVRSIGFALTSSTVPAKGTPTFEIAEDEIEYGVGIHGEPGIRREKMTTANVLATRMLEALLKDLKIDSHTSAEIAILINGFGGTPLQELYLLNNAVARELANNINIKVCVTFVGNYMTSIDMAGASVTLMKLDEELKALLFKESDTPAFKVSGPADSVQYVEITDTSKEETSISYETETPAEYSEMKGNTITLDNMVYLVDKMSEIIIKNEVPFCELDSHAGDGDFGMSIAKGFRQLKREWKPILADGKSDMGSFLNACSLVIMEYCGGASGPIWGSAFRSASKAVVGKKELTIAEFADMMQASVQGIQSTGERSFGRGAVVGDKTLIDALAPCADSWSKSSQAGDDFKAAFAKGADAAIEGAKKTEDFAARMGRAGTVGDRSIGYPDAGAYALGVIFKELSDQMK